MILEVAFLTDRGQIRQHNEDAVGRRLPTDEHERAERGTLFAVADGMGGHRGGAVASQLAVDTIISTYYSAPEENVPESLENAFRAANQVILEKSMNDVSLFGMGTTCTALVIRGEQAYFGHVGDSRAYLYRDGALEQLTDDHSLVGEMVRSGIISNEDALNHPRRNVITRSLGTQEELTADIPKSATTIRVGDVFLLCSDGLTSLVTDRELSDILASSTPHEACQKLVDLANLKGGKDNITVQIIKVVGAD
jgi:serine/threonine protein phosphatase PrpC